MATTDEIADLRRKIGSPTNTAPWTDEILDSMIEQFGGVRAAAKDVWDTKAAEVANMIDISESGSSRSQSQLLENYQKIASGFADSEEDRMGSGFTVSRRARRV